MNFPSKRKEKQLKDQCGQAEDEAMRKFFKSLLKKTKTNIAINLSLACVLQWNRWHRSFPRKRKKKTSHHFHAVDELVVMCATRLVLSKSQCHNGRGRACDFSLFLSSSSFDQRGWKSITQPHLPDEQWIARLPSYVHSCMMNLFTQRTCFRSCSPATWLRHWYDTIQIFSVQHRANYRWIIQRQHRRLSFAVHPHVISKRNVTHIVRIKYSIFWVSTLG